MRFERMVGSLIRSAVTGGRRGRRTGVERLVSRNAGAIGMGLVGLAVGAALENFSQSQQKQGAPAGAGGGSWHPGDDDAGPPPAPRSRPAPPPPPTGRPQGDETAEEADAGLLLVRAMISAAAADGVIDAAERQKIYERLAQDGLDDEERELLEEELANPRTLAELVSEIDAAAPPQDVRDQIYFVSLIAIRADSDAEKRHLKDLSRRLGVSHDKLASWHELAGITL